MAYIGNVGDNDTVDTGQLKDGAVTAAKVAADVATQAELDLKAPIASPVFTGNVGIGTSSPAQKLTLASGYVQVGNGVNAAGGVKYPYSVASADCRNWRTRTDIAGYGDWGIEQSTTQSGETYATKLLINPDGIVTTPYQPAFNVALSGTQLNIATNSPVTILFNYEIFDQNHDFDTGTYTFTAPVTGKYKLEVMLRLNNVDASAVYYHIYFHTSNRTYYSIVSSGGFAGDAAYWTMHCPVLADMDAGDTAYVQIYQAGGASQTDISGGNDTIFLGYLVA
jgi:hypothetical protein